MSSKFDRTEMIIGKDALDKLSKSKVAIFGIGGVGSFVCEGLIRSGIRNFILVDYDTISETNINRQIHATTKTVGHYKVDAMKQRMLEINPDAKIEVYKQSFNPNRNVAPNYETDNKTNNNALKFNNNEILNDNTLNNSSDEASINLDSSIDYIVDAVDTVSTKIELVLQANKLNIPIISCMGTGNKLNPTMFEIADIYKTSVCPLAKVMRKELKTRGIEHLKVVYSKEEPREIFKNEEYEKELQESKKNSIPASISFVPSVAGMILASEVVKDLCKIR